MMEEPQYSKPENPDRPLECSECKKPITTHYTEIAKNKVTHTGMCSECPQLQRYLHGEPQEQTGLKKQKRAGLVCGECGTTLDSVLVAHYVGCGNCYEVFGDVLVKGMLASNQISPKAAKKGKAVPLHIGRSPGETQEVSPSLRLIALNEALEETLKKEDYEQAAWLRDQIKELTEKPEKTDESK